MDIYLVGGAVRDKLLGLPVREHDWVVVGATPEDMRARGFRQVGRDFPVFLHPETGEEYALARTERKTGPGYTGFTFHAAPDVSLEQDLERRDLTINAMAQTPGGELVDPFGGRRDLEHRVLRHVSPAFVEDPLRVLRVARFAARYAPLGFSVAEETLDLMREMVDSGEVDHLVPERVWQELERALAEPAPARFFEIMRETGALVRVVPELDRLFGVPQPEHPHPEVDTGVHTLMALTQAARLTEDPQVRFAALAHDLGKGETPRSEWPRHYGHEESGATLIEMLCARLRAPNAYRDLAVLASRYHDRAHRAAELRPGTVLETLEALDAFRRPERFEQFLLACEADARGRRGYEERPYPQADRLRRALHAAAAVDPKPLVERGLEGEAVGRELRRLRIEAIKRQATSTGGQGTERT